MFGNKSTPANAVASELEPIPGCCAEAAHCSWTVRMGQTHKTNFSKKKE